MKGKKERRKDERKDYISGEKNEAFSCDEITFPFVAFVFIAISNFIFILNLIEDLEIHKIIDQVEYGLSNNFQENKPEFQ